jgi:hypothetical protein
MSGHSELDIAIQETKVLQDALLHEARLHGECLCELVTTKGDYLLLHEHAKSIDREASDYAKELKAIRHRLETTDRLYIEQQAEVSQLKKELAAAQVVITTARAMSEEHQQCLMSQLTQRFGRD